MVVVDQPNIMGALPIAVARDLRDYGGVVARAGDA